jgi:Mn2+/Fe2+ NRAMP family transporter
MVNGILAVPLLIVILRIANNKKIMGERVNSRASNVLGWIITGVMMLAGGTLFYTLF